MVHSPITEEAARMPITNNYLPMPDDPLFKNEGRINFGKWKNIRSMQ